MSTENQLKVAVLGPTGQCGSCVVEELLSRGHHVVGISRNPPKTWKNQSYEGIPVNLHDDAKLSHVFSSGFDAIVCAFAPPISDMSTAYENGVEGHGRVKTALLRSSHDGVFIVIGGAGSLHATNRRQLVDQSDFAFSWWYTWPDAQFHYMRVRAMAHGNPHFAMFILGFRWARNNVEKPGWLSWLFRPLAWMYLAYAKRTLTGRHVRALITCSRMALTMWEGVKDKKWSFLSPPGLLRDRGIRTGEYKVIEDSEEDPSVEAIERGVYNEDMAVAIVDEIEKPRLTFKHWSCVGRVGLAECSGWRSGPASPSEGEWGTSDAIYTSEFGIPL